jgi:hypothetical protein
VLLLIFLIRTLFRGKGRNPYKYFVGVLVYLNFKDANIFF